MLYVPTESRKRIWEASWIYCDTHIQLCVREQNNILAVWHALSAPVEAVPRHENGNNTTSAASYMCVAGKIGKMTGSEFRASLVRAGIITTKGTLKLQYKKGVSKSKTKKK